MKEIYNAIQRYSVTKNVTTLKAAFSIRGQHTRFRELGKMSLEFAAEFARGENCIKEGI